MNLIRKYLNSFTDFVFPKICIVSGEKLPETNSNPYVKDEILNNLERLTLFDISELKRKIENKNCFSLYRFKENSEIQTIIHHIKYSGFKKLGFLLGELIAKDLLENYNYLLNYDCIIPIPLHKTKIRERGYNQSEYISRGINEHLKLNYDNFSFIRKKDTQSQTKLNIEERYKNMKDAFAVAPKHKNSLKGKKIILVDDIITTGATIVEAVKTLQKAKVSEIFIVSLALTVFD